jgi:hypothetical protein
MKVFAFLFLLSSQLSLAVGANRTELLGAWLEVDSKWINAPKEIVPREQWSQTAVIYFGKDHKFALINCTVLRVPRKYINISDGDPRGVYTGEWSVHDEMVDLTYQLVERTIFLEGQKIPGPVQHATITVSGGPTLGFGGKKFRREAALDESAGRAISETIRVPAPSE